MVADHTDIGAQAFRLLNGALAGAAAGLVTFGLTMAGMAAGSGTFTQSMTLARVHQYLSMATPLLWTRQPDTIGVLGLALNACSEPDSR